MYITHQKRYLVSGGFPKQIRGEEFADYFKRNTSTQQRLENGCLLIVSFMREHTYILA